MYAKDPYEAKYKFLINKRESIGLNYFNDPKAFIKYSNNMQDLNKRELQQIALNHSSDIDFKDFIKTYKKCTAEPYSFLVNDTILPSDNPLRFTKNILNKYIKKW